MFIALILIIINLQFAGSSMEEDRARQETVAASTQPQQPGGFAVSAYPVKLAPVSLPVAGENSMENLTLGPSSSQQKPLTKPIRPIPILPLPPSSKMADLNLNQKAMQTQAIEPALPLSLKLSAPSSSSSDEKSAPKTSHSSAFQAMSSGDSIISVA